MAGHGAFLKETFLEVVARASNTRILYRSIKGQSEDGCSWYGDTTAPRKGQGPITAIAGSSQRPM